MSLKVPTTLNMTSKQLKLKANEFLGPRKCAQSLLYIIQHFQVSTVLYISTGPNTNVWLRRIKGPCEVMCMTSVYESLWMGRSCETGFRSLRIGRPL